VVIGADVEGLFPSLPDVEVAVICYNAIMSSGINFESIDFHKAGKYVAMHLTKEEQAISPLARVLPRRTAKGGVRPGVSSDPRKDDGWEFPKVERTELEERMLVAMAVEIGIVAMMNTHQYSFDGKTVLQKAGGPIGLRATCAVARVVMNTWDTRWLERVENNNIRILTGVRYMDDIRIFARAIREGWRWRDGALYYCDTWKNEDQMAGTSSTARTARVMVDIMDSIMEFLNFTIEIGEDFADGMQEQP
jgi:hypothetical protein